MYSIENQADEIKKPILRKGVFVKICDISQIFVKYR
jgi:hypothetical protein